MRTQSIRKRLAKPLSSSLLLAFLVSACGGDGNMFEAASGKPPASAGSAKENAIESIMAEDWTAAEAQLEAILKENPNDQQARSMLGSVLMKKSGIETLQVADDVESSSDENGTVHVPTMITLLPPATAENVENLAKSIATFEEIPADERTAPQKLQLAMAQFSYAMILTKKVAADDAGTYDGTKAADMTTEEADSIVDMMDTSAVTVSDIGGETNATGSAKISKTTDKIREQAGDTTADKLRAYLEAESAKAIIK